MATNVFICITRLARSFFFFLNDPATTEISTLSLHDALPISHCREQSGKIDALARADRHGLDDRRDLGEYLRLRLLVRRNEREHRFDLGYRIERLERRDPLAELAQRAGGRERDEARAARGAENALLPVDRLGAARLEVEEIVVEADAAQRDERERGGHGGESDDDPRMPSEPGGEPHGLRPDFTSPVD